MYPASGQTGCSYTGSGGGANPMERIICAEDATGTASSNGAINKERTTRLRFMQFPLQISFHLPHPRLLLRAASMKKPNFSGAVALPRIPSVGNDHSCARGINLVRIAHAPRGARSGALQ